MKKLICKNALIAFICIMIIIFISAGVSGFGPIWLNSIAMRQFENSYESYILMESYHRIMIAINVIQIAVGVFGLGKIGLNIYNYIKNER